MTADRATEARQRAKALHKSAGIVAGFGNDEAAALWTAQADDVLWLLDERERLTEANAALEAAAYYYRRELKEILADCDHDRPRIEKIKERAETAIRAADHALSAVSERKPA